MPTISVKGVKPERLCTVSHKLIDNLVEAIKCPRDYFEIECLNVVSVTSGSITAPYPFVEIGWFDRGLEVQDTVAKIITDTLKDQLGVNEVDLAFKVFEKRSYYENGNHF